MKRTINIIAVVAILCMLLPANATAQKKGGKKKKATTTRLVTYPARSSEWNTDAQLESIDTYDAARINDYQYTVLPSPWFKGHVLAREANHKTVTLRQVSCRENDITDDEWWFERNGLTNRVTRIESQPFTEILPRYYINTGGYVVVLIGESYGQTNRVVITDENLKNVYGAYDFSNYEQNGIAHNWDTSQYINDVMIEGNIMYVNHSGLSYSDGYDHLTGYISAINLFTNEVLWTSQPKTCNSRMCIEGNSIICGYGFTDEPDFLYVVDKYSGQHTQKLFVRKAVYTPIVKGRKCYVRTYSYDYEFTF